jgi:surface antigen
MLKRVMSAIVGASFLMAAAAPAAQASPPPWSNGKKHHVERDWDSQGDYRGDYRGDYHRHGGHSHKHKHKHKTKHRHDHGRDRHYDRPTRASGVDFSGINGGHLIGAILGAAAGTQIGSGSGRTVAIISGTLIGAVLGGRISDTMQHGDLQRSHGALETARDGQTVAWQNPNTNSRYRVTPKRTYKSASNQYCREYSSWAFVDGYEEQVYGTACRMPDGSWKIVE